MWPSFGRAAGPRTSGADKNLSYDSRCSVRLDVRVRAAFAWYTAKGFSTMRFSAVDVGASTAHVPGTCHATCALAPRRECPRGSCVAGRGGDAGPVLDRPHSRAGNRDFRERAHRLCCVEVPRTTGAFTIKSQLVVKIILRSFDVAHSFYLIDFDLKIDVIPGHTNFYWFKPLQPGNFMIRCAEFCGLNHYTMTATLKVVR